MGVVGLGGLGHMAVKIASAMGAEVTMLSTSPSKAADATRLGAKHFASTKDEATFTQLAGSFDVILDTVSAPHDYNGYLGLLRPYGTMICVGAPPEPSPMSAFSLIGGIPETQEMLDFCGKHGIVSDVEIIPATQVNEAYERLLKNDVRYRFVIDGATLRG